MSIVRSNVHSASIVRDASGDLDPRDFEGACELAKYVASTKLNGVTSPQDALTRILTGRELGWRAMASIRGIHIIEGKAVIAADAMHAICVNSPDCERFECVENTDERVTYAVKKRGSTEHRVTWTLEDAKRAGLVSRGTWAKFPRQMLHARCKSEAARLVFPERLFGMYAREDFDVDAKAGVTVQSAPVVEASPHDPSLAADLLSRIAGADVAESKKLRDEIKAHVDAGRVTQVEADELRKAYSAKFAKKKTVSEAEVISAQPSPENASAADADGVIDRGDNPDAY